MIKYHASDLTRVCYENVKVRELALLQKGKVE